MYPDTFRPEPRCHVCRTDPIREQVNAMLARGSPTPRSFEPSWSTAPTS